MQRARKRAATAAVAFVSVLGVSAPARGATCPDPPDRTPGRLQSLKVSLDGYAHGLLEMVRSCYGENGEVTDPLPPACERAIGVCRSASSAVNAADASSVSMNQYVRDITSPWLGETLLLTDPLVRPAAFSKACELAVLSTKAKAKARVAKVDAFSSYVYRVYSTWITWRIWAAKRTAACHQKEAREKAAGEAAGEKEKAADSAATDQGSTAQGTTPVKEGGTGDSGAARTGGAGDSGAARIGGTGGTAGAAGSSRTPGGATKSAARCRLGVIRQVPGKAMVYRCPDCSEAHVRLTVGVRETTQAERQASLRSQCGLAAESSTGAGISSSGGASGSQPREEVAGPGPDAASTGGAPTATRTAPMPRPKTPDDAVSELRTAMNTGIDSDAVAAALAKGSTAEKVAYAGSLGLLLLTLPSSGGGDKIEDDSALGDASPHSIGAYFAAGGAAAYSTFGLWYLGSHNEKLAKRLAADSPRWLERLKQDCAAGRPQSCEDAVELSVRINDLARSPADRQSSSPLRGFGSWWGPAFEWRMAAGYSKESYAGTLPGTPTLELAGSMGGGVMETVLRNRFVRLGLSYSQLFGDLIDDQQLAGQQVRHTATGVSVLGVGAGVQAGQGLLSPYLEGRVRFSGLSGDLEVALDSSSRGMPQERDLSGTAGVDYALVLGNTFNLGGLFSTPGPFVRSLVVDAAYITPLGDARLRGGFALSAGFSAQWPFDFSRYRVRETPDDDPDLKKTGVFGFVFPVGAGIEIGRGVETDGGSKIGLGSLWLGFGKGEIDTAGFWLIAFWKRLNFGHRGDHEIGLLAGPLGLQWSRRYDRPGEMEVVKADGRALSNVWGLVPSAVYYRNYSTGFPVELGLRSPLLWFTTTPTVDDSISFGFFDGVPPALLYAGTGF